MRSIGPTVYDRVKRTGYMMGPGHVMGPALDSANKPDMMAPKAAPGDEAGSGEPPNYRDSAGGAESCGDCSSFAEQHCDKYGRPVTPNMVCDSFEEGDDNEQKSASSAPEKEEDLTSQT